MKNFNLYYSLDKTFKLGTDVTEIRRKRAAGEKVEEHYNPKPTAIYLCATVKGKYVKLNTGIKIKPADWDFEEQRPLLRKRSYYLDMQILLDGIHNRAMKEYLNLRNNTTEPITMKVILELMGKAIALDNDKSETALDFWSVYDLFYKYKTQNSKANNMTKYNSMKKTLTDFEAVHYKLTFEKITKTFFEEFRTYSMKVKQHLNATIGKNTKCLKCFLKWAAEHDEKYNRNESFKKFKTESDKTVPIFLKENELKTIEELSLGENDSQVLSKDLLLFLCYSGQRISDVQNLKLSDIKSYPDGRKFWYLWQIKGNKDYPVEIPLLKEAEKILEKYVPGIKSDDFIFPYQSDTMLNKNIKKIGKAAGITEQTTKVNFRGKERVVISKPKYDMMSSKIGRKTFVSLCMQRGMSDMEIISLTGHTTPAQAKPYAGIDPDTLRTKFADAWGNKPSNLQTISEKNYSE